MYSNQKILVANRGEIAVRILRTAKALGLPSVAIYTPSDSIAPHVTEADEAVILPLSSDTEESGTSDSESRAYLSGSAIVSICKRHQVTLVHPGYGFLSENAEFARQIGEAGITWLGPRPEVIRTMGLKHEARRAALAAGLPVVPGSDGLVEHLDDALNVTQKIGFPAMLKATAGGGGMGMVACFNETDLRERFSATRDRAKTLFGDEGLFLERYFPAARHIEIQVFGNGRGDVVHMRERECSIQRRHQKVIEETPSPFLASRPELRSKMCAAAVALCQSLRYGSAGTVEFLVDDLKADFYFLEMNTRIQVEHAITEVTHPGLDLVKLMIDQGLAERRDSEGLDPTSPEMNQEMYDKLRDKGLKLAQHAIEARLYSENPAEDFTPCPGLLQYVEIDSEHHDWLRVDTWVSTGTNVTPFFDPLLCKLVVTGKSRNEALLRLSSTLNHAKICGPPNNLEFLKGILEDDTFRQGRATTRFLEQFKFIPRALKVLAAGIETTIQDLPGRTIGLGIPRSGPMDSLAFRTANMLVGNPSGTEGLEIVALPGVECAFVFHVPCVVSVTGKGVSIMLDGVSLEMWSKILVPAGCNLTLEAKPVGDDASGLRTYLAVRGGFPDVPLYLGSKSTSMGLGGYQGRSLIDGDQLALGDCSPTMQDVVVSLPRLLLPIYPVDWVIYVLAGPQDTEEFVTREGTEKFYSTRWQVSASSNRMGIRLDSPEKVMWARSNGGEGGSHPSNILDNGYALGSINVNGDTPVILTNEGPDAGGYVCLCTVASAEMWKIGQLGAGNTVQFRRIPFANALRLKDKCEEWFTCVQKAISGDLLGPLMNPYHSSTEDKHEDPRLQAKLSSSKKPLVVFRQAGDSAILIEYGDITLDFNSRVRAHGLELEMRKRNLRGLRYFSPCIRSTMCHFDPSLVSQSEVLAALLEANDALPESVTDMSFSGRRITFPVVLDDSWSREALKRYMSTTRNKAVYLPSNIDYLAANNGLKGGAEEALQKFLASDWLVFGVGFYLACPFIVPIDPRCRLVGQKMNPSRTFTPRGAVGHAGVVSAIYPVESPGGYQLWGRSLPAWQTWGRGTNFTPEQPWLLQPFDQIRFEAVDETEYLELEKQFDAGLYTFKIESTTFSMANYAKFVESVADEVSEFRENQQQAVDREELREQELLREWELTKKAGGGNLESVAQGDGPIDSSKVVASLFASVWKIRCSVGDVVDKADDVLVVLEAMKTEISVKAGKSNVGKTIRGFGSGIREGAMVKPGDILVFLV